MKTQFKLSLLLSALLLIAACTHDPAITDESPTASSEIKQWKPSDGLKKFIPQEYLANIRAEDLSYIERELRGEPSLEPRHQEIHIAAGTTNKLAAAIAAAQYGDVIVLDPGDHFETGTVVIDRPVAIVGYGANLIFSNTPLPTTSNNFLAGLHFKNGSDISTVRGVTFKGKDAIPGLAVFVDQVDQIKILDNTFENWHSSIFVYNGDYNTIWRNKVHCNRSWLQGLAPDAYGIVFSDGRQNLVIQNEIDGGLFGIWTGGAQGTDFHNKTTECLYGQILCKVPAGGFASGGTVVATKGTTSHWLANYNTSNNNFAAGYLVIDGAHHNLLEHNIASGNAAYDIELTGDTHRFGFLTPKSAHNKVYAYSTLKVKDCGDQNKVYGGIRVDTALDPCN